MCTAQVSFPTRGGWAEALADPNAVSTIALVDA